MYVTATSAIHNTTTHCEGFDPGISHKVCYITTSCQVVGPSLPPTPFIRLLLNKAIYCMPTNFVLLRNVLRIDDAAHYITDTN